METVRELSGAEGPPSELMAVAGAVVSHVKIYSESSPPAPPRLAAGPRFYCPLSLYVGDDLFSEVVAVFSSPSGVGSGHIFEGGP